MRLRTLILLLLGVLVAGLVSVRATTPEFLRPEEAFKVDAKLLAEPDGPLLLVNWQIREGYYLYRKRFAVTVDAPGVQLGSLSIPKGEITEDEYFGKSEIYRQQVDIRVPATIAPGINDLQLKLRSQGCADAGLCYPPETRLVTVAVPANMLAAAASQPPVSANAGAQKAANPAKVAQLAQLMGVAPAKPATAQSPAPGTTPGTSSDGSTGDKQDALQILSGATFGNTQPQFLDPEVAFQLDTRVDADATLHVRWRIEPAYYLYRHKFGFRVLNATKPVLGAPRISPGERKTDEYFGEVEVYYGAAEAVVPFIAKPNTDAIEVEVTYQGCADAGLCYPPIKKTFAHTLPAGFSVLRSANASTSPPTSGAMASQAGGTSQAQSTQDQATQGQSVQETVAQGIAVTTQPVTMRSEQDQLAGLLAGGNLWLIIAAFFGGGLLLSLTPCVFPMVPILSSIIVGQGDKLSRARAFVLSFVYVQGMAITYTVVGIVAGKSGANLQVFFQDPWVLSVFALIFVLLALSMFGFYELQLPASWQSRLSEVSNRQQGGSYTGVAVMGVLSALIVGPCVAPPLFGALAYISTTGDAFLGGVALYALSMGMGVPLLLVGISAGEILPRAGAWMDAVKRVFGVALIGVAIFFLERILPGWITMLLWAALLIVSAIYMGALDAVEAAASGWRRLWKGMGLVALTYGVLLMVGASAGNTDPLQPLGGVGLGSNSTAKKLEFRWVKGPAGLDAALAEAQAAGRPAMLDYYADWCIACKEMDKYTFSDPKVQAALANVVLLKTDVTKDDAEDKALMKRFGLYGPPTIQFFPPGRAEVAGYRVVGFMDAAKFKAHVDKAMNAMRVSG